MTKEEFLKSLAPSQKAELEKQAEAFNEECKNLVAYLNARKEAGASRPAVFLSLGAYFFGEMCHLTAAQGHSLALLGVEAAMRHGERLFRASQGAVEPSEDSLQPTQKAAAA